MCLRPIRIAQIILADPLPFFLILPIAKVDSGANGLLEFFVRAVSEYQNSPKSSR